MFELQTDDLCLERIARSGQCFRMTPLMNAGEKAADEVRGRARSDQKTRRSAEPGREASSGDGGVYAAISGGHYLEIRQSGQDFLFSCPQEEFEAIWLPYFDLDTDYKAVRDRVDPQDSYLQAAMEYGRGIRILKQDLWEILITFLISQNNNIPRIKKSVEALCSRYGTPARGVSLDGRPVPFYTFPSPERLAEGGLAGLEGLGLGYRDTYILAMAEHCRDGSWLEELRRASCETARRMLLGELGIGQKVADCVCLFALHHVGAFPVDTHIRQILKLHYPGGWPADRYDGVAGILQQYMFFYHLNARLTGSPPSGPAAS